MSNTDVALLTEIYSHGECSDHKRNEQFWQTLSRLDVDSISQKDLQSVSDFWSAMVMAASSAQAIYKFPLTLELCQYIMIVCHTSIRLSKALNSPSPALAISGFSSDYFCEPSAPSVYPTRQIAISQGATKFLKFISATNRISEISFSDFVAWGLSFSIDHLKPKNLSQLSTFILSFTLPSQEEFTQKLLSTDSLEAVASFIRSLSFQYNAIHFLFARFMYEELFSIILPAQLSSEEFLPYFISLYSSAPTEDFLPFAAAFVFVRGQKLRFSDLLSASITSAPFITVLSLSRMLETSEKIIFDESIDPQSLLCAAFAKNIEEGKIAELFEDIDKRKLNEQWSSAIAVIRKEFGVPKTKEAMLKASEEGDIQSAIELLELPDILEYLKPNSSKLHKKLYHIMTKKKLDSEDIITEAIELWKEPCDDKRRALFEQSLRMVISDTHAIASTPLHQLLIYIGVAPDGIKLPQKIEVPKSAADFLRIDEDIPFSVANAGLFYSLNGADQSFISGLDFKYLAYHTCLTNEVKGLIKKDVESRNMLIFSCLSIKEWRKEAVVELMPIISEQENMGIGKAALDICMDDEDAASVSRIIIGNNEYLFDCIKRYSEERANSLMKIVFSNDESNLSVQMAEKLISYGKKEMVFSNLAKLSMEKSEIAEKIFNQLTSEAFNPLISTLEAFCKLPHSITESSAAFLSSIIPPYKGNSITQKAERKEFIKVGWEEPHKIAEEKKNRSIYDWPTEEQICTYKKTGKDYLKQPWFHCYTCGLTEHSGCCLPCALTCHAHDHYLIFAGTSNFYCDCYESHACIHNQENNITEQEPENPKESDQAIPQNVLIPFLTWLLNARFQNSQITSNSLTQIQTESDQAPIAFERSLRGRVFDFKTATRDYKSDPAILAAINLRNKIAPTILALSFETSLITATGKMLQSYSLPSLSKSASTTLPSPIISLCASTSAIAALCPSSIAIFDQELNISSTFDLPALPITFIWVQDSVCVLFEKSIALYGNNSSSLTFEASATSIVAKGSNLIVSFSNSKFSVFSVAENKITLLASYPAIYISAQAILSYSKATDLVFISNPEGPLYYIRFADLQAGSSPLTISCNTVLCSSSFICVSPTDNSVHYFISTESGRIMSVTFSSSIFVSSDVFVAKNCELPSINSANSIGIFAQKSTLYTVDSRGSIRSIVRKSKALQKPPITVPPSFWAESEADNSIVHLSGLVEDCNQLLSGNGIFIPCDSPHIITAKAVSSSKVVVGFRIIYENSESDKIPQWISLNSRRYEVRPDCPIVQLPATPSDALGGSFDIEIGMESVCGVALVRIDAFVANSSQIPEENDENDICEEANDCLKKAIKSCVERVEPHSISRDVAKQIASICYERAEYSKVIQHILLAAEIDGIDEVMEEAIEAAIKENRYAEEQIGRIWKDISGLPEGLRKKAAEVAWEKLKYESSFCVISAFTS